MINKLATLILFTVIPSLAHAMNVEAKCDGALAQGSYRVSTDEGIVRITGEYSEGNRFGTFTIYDPAGEKLIELPYKQGILSGTIRAWYTPDTSELSESQPKLLSDVHGGLVEGQYQTWYPNGAKRSSAVINDGNIESFEAWQPDGSPLEITDQQAFLGTDIEADFAYYAQLEQVLDAYPPVCQ